MGVVFGGSTRPAIFGSAAQRPRRSRFRRFVPSAGLARGSDDRRSHPVRASARSDDQRGRRTTVCDDRPRHGSHRADRLPARLPRIRRRVGRDQDRSTSAAADQRATSTRASPRTSAATTKAVVHRHSDRPSLKPPRVVSCCNREPSCPVSSTINPHCSTTLRSCPGPIPARCTACRGAECQAPRSEHPGPGSTVRRARHGLGSSRQSRMPWGGSAYPGVGIGIVVR